MLAGEDVSIPAARRSILAYPAGVRRLAQPLPLNRRNGTSTLAPSAAGPTRPLPPCQLSGAIPPLRVHSHSIVPPLRHLEAPNPVQWPEICLAH